MKNFCPCSVPMKLWEPASLPRTLSASETAPESTALCLTWPRATAASVTWAVSPVPLCQGSEQESTGLRLGLEAEVSHIGMF